MIMDNYYNILNVRSDASQEVIRAAYKALSMIYHPDRNSSQDANKRMQDLNLAYSVLSDHEKRMEYDRSLLENSINEDFENDEAFTEELKEKIFESILDQLHENISNLKEYQKRFDQKMKDKDWAQQEEKWQEQKAKWDQEHEEFRNQFRENFRKSRQQPETKTKFSEEKDAVVESGEVFEPITSTLTIAIPERKTDGRSEVIDKTERKNNISDNLRVVEDRLEPTLSQAPVVNTHVTNESNTLSQEAGRNSENEKPIKQEGDGLDESKNSDKQQDISPLTFKEWRWIIVTAYLILSYFLVMGNEWYSFWITDKPSQQERTVRRSGLEDTTQRGPQSTDSVAPRPGAIPKEKPQSYRDTLIRNQVF